MDKLFILIPAYNEEANIEKILMDWYPILDGTSEESRIIINCSGSRDRTTEIIKKIKRDFPKIDILSDSENSYGHKVVDLYDYAVDNCADYIFQTDSDGQTDPTDFSKFWNLRKQYDAIIGSRQHREDGLTRQLVMKVVCLLIHLYFGVTVPDANVPFRLMNYRILSKYMNMIPRQYSMPNIMLTAYMAYYRENITFKEINFAARNAGEQSMNIRKIIKIGCNSLIAFSRARKEMD